jgi:5-methyltetrahydropteroyltriglutamate--homocysteine methyltransferase
LPREKKLILGLVTTKSGELEKPDDLKRRIDEASKLVPLDQLGISPQCGFSSTVLGNKLTIDDQIAKLRLVVQVAKDVWGSA